MTRFWPQFLRAEPWQQRLGYGPLDILHHRLRAAPFAPRLFCAWIVARLHELLSEARSLVGRMKTRRERQHYLVTVGPAWVTDPTQRLVPCTRTRARTTDIQEMLSNRPWASLVDLEIFLEGWDRGEKWASQECNSESRNAQSDTTNHCSLSASESNGQSLAQMSHL
jgi:hypothetical protein